MPCRKPDHERLGKSQRRYGLSGFDESLMIKRPQTTQYITLKQIGFHEYELSVTQELALVILTNSSCR